MSATDVLDARGRSRSRQAEPDARRCEPTSVRAEGDWRAARDAAPAQGAQGCRHPGERDKTSRAEEAEEELRRLSERHAQLNARVEQLERANGDLRARNQALEQRLEMGRPPDESEGRAGVDQVKVVHLLRGAPGAAKAAGSCPKGGGGAAADAVALREENAALRAEVQQLRITAGAPGVTAGDLVHQQGLRQLERFKKATRKYVQDFREGLYGLLGWKAELKETKGGMQWHLSSRFQDPNEVLIFQLRPSKGAGAPAEFDLLSTPWGEELQGDRQAMAYLEVYQSIPGFLAHITADLLTRRSVA